jgi:peroxiredoxin
LRDHEENLRKRNVKVVVVTFEAPLLSQIYVKENSQDWPLIIDETRELYRSYGMFSSSFWDIWGPKTWVAYLRAILNGYKIKKSESDVKQRGGDVLIDPDGIIQLHYIGRGPADRPSVEMIIQRIIDWQTIH